MARKGMRVTELVALAVFGLSLFLFASILLYAPEEFFGAAAYQEFTYTCARGLYENLGAASHVLLLLTAFWSGAVFFQNRVGNLGLKTFGTAVLTVAVAALATLGSKPDTGEPHKLVAGGLVGVFLEGHLLASLGRTLAFLLVGLTALISLIFATDWFFYDLVRGFRARDRAEDEQPSEPLAPATEPEPEGPGIGADLLAVAAPLAPEPPVAVMEEEPVPAAVQPHQEPTPEETNGSREAVRAEDDAPLFREAPPAAPRFAVPRSLAPDAEAELEHEMDQLGSHLQRVRSKIVGPGERRPSGGVTGEETEALTSPPGGDAAVYERAVEAVIAAGRASVSLLQRRLNLTYNQAHQMMDRMEREGVVGGYQGIKPRDVLVSAEEWAARRR